MKIGFPKPLFRVRRLYSKIFYTDLVEEAGDLIPEEKENTTIKWTVDLNFSNKAQTKQKLVGADFGEFVATFKDRIQQLIVQQEKKGTGVSDIFMIFDEYKYYLDNYEVVLSGKKVKEGKFPPISNSNQLDASFIILSKLSETYDKDGNYNWAYHYKFYRILDIEDDKYYVEDFHNGTLSVFDFTYTWYHLRKMECFIYVPYYIQM